MRTKKDIILNCVDIRASDQNFEYRRRVQAVAEASTTTSSGYRRPAFLSTNDSSKVTFPMTNAIAVPSNVPFVSPSLQSAVLNPLRLKLSPSPKITTAYNFSAANKAKKMIAITKASIQQLLFLTQF